MKRFSQRAAQSLVEIGPRFLPFADAASDTLPLGRLLRLSLFQVSVGMALVLMVGTLNRVMIVELDVPSTIVAIMISLPLVFAPFRALIGFKSDTHVSALGWRRVPYIWKGSLLQWGGFAIMPFALLVLSGKDYAEGTPEWIGQASAGLAFLLVGAGAHMVQTVGLALATDLAPREDQPKVVGLMYVMLLVGMIASALIFGALLTPYHPWTLIQVIQGAAVATLILNVIALWKQEPRDRARTVKPEVEPEFADHWREFISRKNALRGLIVIALGTMGFGMADVLLEPYGGQVLAMTVAQTTKLTAAWAFGGLVGFALASRILGRGYDPLRMAAWGAAVGLPGFGAVIAAGPGGAEMLFVAGVVIVGFGGGLFSHGTLTATMRLAPKEQVGLALGAWGAVQATAAGAGVALGGVMRDVVRSQPFGATFGEATPYLTVFALELLLLMLALVVVLPMVLNRSLAAERS
ncbi:MFS transporter [Rhodobacter veldkampii DSM 11550]|uniref:MFS transporter n=1 Tax=Phaeovulum veldkampii DSM 11550 TaxID=1185920 RepID=A0A2T4JFS9_9RHOB|nr:PucC family protein [Phaeovulum veldkampii]MBK5945321.1 MFS transporter [Phaeovulum veldkampii DSM 11550]NCU19852.1 PucC family protein [Candidatus Falkowbacteria bacterium]PTE16693.1 MFS transporter [Phaeovulum veldkampii DSM 11550]TDQ60315.1 BCD family chlorophyll transporter-like MFS transporter [Phaeovulum veldkampii DSM 11550]